MKRTATPSENGPAQQARVPESIVGTVKQRDGNMCDFWAGVAGSAVGAGGALAGVWLNQFLQGYRSNRRDKGRRTLLRQMLDNKPQDSDWRKLKTLARVIGASEDETSRLLIDIGARGSETESNVWAYIKDKPIR